MAERDVPFPESLSGGQGAGQLGALVESLLRAYLDWRMRPFEPEDVWGLGGGGLAARVRPIRVRGIALPGPFGRVLRADPELRQGPSVRQGSGGDPDLVSRWLHQERYRAERAPEFQPVPPRRIGPFAEHVNVERALGTMKPTPFDPVAQHALTPGERLIMQLVDALRLSGRQ